MAFERAAGRLANAGVVSEPFTLDTAVRFGIGAMRAIPFGPGGESLSPGAQVYRTKVHQSANTRKFIRIARERMIAA